MGATLESRASVGSPPHIDYAGVNKVDFPQRVTGAGSMFQYNELREVPDEFNMVIDYAGGPSVVLTNSLSNATGCATVVRGTDGALTFESSGMVITPHGAKKPSHVIP